MLQHRAASCDIVQATLAPALVGWAQSTSVTVELKGLALQAAATVVSAHSSRSGKPELAAQLVALTVLAAKQTQAEVDANPKRTVALPHAPRRAAQGRLHRGDG